MGASVQWRHPPARVDRHHGDIVEFGRGRSRGSGYLAHSDRVGQSVLLLEADGGARAGTLNEAGFTVLVPDVVADREGDPVLHAAAEYLSANWHPRLGLVAIGDYGARAAATLVERRVDMDVVVLYEKTLPPGVVPHAPVVGHFTAGPELPSAQGFFAAVADSGREHEFYVYETEAESLSPEVISLADARTVDALEYYLS